MLKLLLVVLAAAVAALGAKSDPYQYDNEFVNSSYLLEHHYPARTFMAQRTIFQWADEAAIGGPWSVFNKSVVPPSGTKHNYMSWAPYWWPNCTGVGNTTELTPEQIWVTCPYYSRDGLFNPDVRTLVNDTVTVNKMCDAVFYNTIAWALDRNPKYEKRAAHYIDTWFLNPDTYMLPNLDYGQMHRGPTGQKGTNTGVLDLKCMAKVASGIQILRDGHSKAWTPELDDQMQKWSTAYLNWLQTAKIALQEKATINNHVAFYYNQVTALKLILKDKAGAKALLEEFFSGPYLNMIDANGEQPLEAERSRPYHYRSYNLAALFTNARLAQYVDWHVWDLPTKNNGTIQKAVEFAMTIDPLDEQADELYTKVAATASIYGDKHGKYAKFLESKAENYTSEAYFLWNQPLAALSYDW